MILHVLLLNLTLAAASHSTESPFPARPNIILLLSDDQDWNGLSTRMQDADRLQAKLLARLSEAAAKMPQPNPAYDPTQSPAPRKGGKGGRRRTPSP